MKLSSSLTALWSLILVPLTSCSNAAGRHYLEENRKMHDVHVLPSGVQYKILKRGTGDHHPHEGSTIRYTWEGWTAENFPDGTPYDKSHEHMWAEDVPHHMPTGIKEIMKLMVEGDEWEAHIPSELAYDYLDLRSGEKRPAGVSKGDVIVLRMHLMKILTTGEEARIPHKRCHPKTLKNCNDKQKAFIEKMHSKEVHEKELDRLHKVKSGKVHKNQQHWIFDRLHILQHMRDHKHFDEDL
eukprot:TRINITY_DN89272_c0_g1_i1.p1 TRINITY_DN89272_c0_g1~~TRINITY_DN89272_c0_g1_i1.p1  ORF type:complete len:240 (-),score=32.26 TRINITY_DN89272_c0_g1_i1:60-779(-)